jgi:chromosome segregation ATPase
MENEKSKDAVIAELTSRVAELEYNETQTNQWFYDLTAQLSTMMAEKAKLAEAYGLLDGQNAILAIEANEHEKLNHALTARVEGLLNRVYQLQRALDEMSAEKHKILQRYNDGIQLVNVQRAQLDDLKGERAFLQNQIKNLMTACALRDVALQQAKQGKQ